MLCVQGIWFTGGGDRRALEAAKAKCVPLKHFPKYALLLHGLQAELTLWPMECSMNFCVLRDVPGHDIWLWGFRCLQQYDSRGYRYQGYQTIGDYQHMYGLKHSWVRWPPCTSAA